MAPDGRSVTQPLSEAEKKNLQPPTTNETANWKTYRNDKLGISVKYPTGITVEESTQPQFSFWWAAENLVVEFEEGNFGVDQNLLRTERIIIDGSSGTNSLFASGAHPKEVFFIITNVKHGTKDFTISIQRPNDPYGKNPLTKEDTDLYSKILSTFKFL